MSGGVEIIGLAGLRENIARAMADTEMKIQQAIEEIGDVGVFESERRCPIDEGFLAASITKQVGRDEDGMSCIIKVPNNSPAVHYALAMHEGNYQPGEKSLDKEAKSGVKVGSECETSAGNGGSSCTAGARQPEQAGGSRAMLLTPRQAESDFYLFLFMRCFFFPVCFIFFLYCNEGL